MIKLNFLVTAIAVALVVSSLAPVASAKTNADSSKESNLIKSVNAAVDSLETRIKNKDETLALLAVEYQGQSEGEGVPPSFKFYFENKKVGSKDKSVLRVAKTHIGHEVYSVDRAYYFDENGQAMKFLEVNSGVAEAGQSSSREGIIYEKSGRKIWSSSKAAAPISMIDVRSMFEVIEKNLEKSQ